MNKSAINKYAVWARNELIARVAQKAVAYGITEAEIIPASADSIKGRLLTPSEKKQRTALIEKINMKGYKQVIEEVAYIWFNRFTAIRFMEVNGYLPTHIRVFTDEENNFAPQILAEAIHLDMPGLKMDTVYELKQANKTEELYKYLLITQCNALQAILPGMFQKIEDYTELLLPDNLLREGSVIERMIKDIPEADWTEQVEILGWMYQYYISEKHDQIINIYKGTVKKEDIPAATQLFTTDWVVRYMVDNSLGRYWIERHPESQLADKLEFFVKPKNGKINYINETVTPQEMTFFDPCMGSGHILVYAFDVLMEIYRESGYSDRDAVAEIVQNNIFGLDIDDRCSQLAYFAVMMKARSYDRRFLTRGIAPHVYAIQESNELRGFARGRVTPDAEKNKIGEYLVEVFKHAKEIGSIALVKKLDYESFRNYLDECKDSSYIDIELSAWIMNELPLLQQLVNQAEMLTKKYAVVCTNPPYMGKMEGKLKPYVLDNFKDYSGDLFSVFVYHNFSFCKKDGYSAFMTPFVWMFIKTYEPLRRFVINSKALSSLIQMEYSAFEEATVPICSYVLKNGKPTEKSLCFRLSDFRGGMAVQKEKVLAAIANPECGYFYESNQYDFSKIPGSPIAYWLSDALLNTFQNKKIGDYGDANNGFTTGDNNLFLRYWYEVDSSNIQFGASSIEDAKNSRCRWFPYNKGGAFRKWYGNNDYVINWHNDGAEIKAYGHLVPRSMGYQFRRSFSWSKISSSYCSFKIKEQGTMFDVAGLSMFPNSDSDFNYLLGLCNSKYAQACLNFLSPTLNYETGHIASIPVIISNIHKERIDSLVAENISISKQDWDSYETSWDFTMHPLVALRMSSAYAWGNNKPTLKLSSVWKAWELLCSERFDKLKRNEEELNKLFIEIYGLQGEMTEEVEDKDVTVRKADLERDVRSLLSYAVGCMFGRYSLDSEGLILAGNSFESRFVRDPSGFGTTMVGNYIRTQNGSSDLKMCTYFPDKDGILPICDDDYFEDDIVGKFIKFIEIVYGSATLEENLKFIADALGGSGSPREVIRTYFLNEFYADHLKIYQKRPIYWQFNSGKKDGFKCLIYIHRYQPDTIARIRTDYVHEQQARYRTAITDVEQRLHNAQSSERVRLNKLLQKLNDQDAEIQLFEEKIHHLADQMIRLDLDNGVKTNYEIFKDVLTKIK